MLRHPQNVFTQTVTWPNKPSQPLTLQAGFGQVIMMMIMPEELHNGKNDDADGEEDGEQDPVKVVEQTKIGPTTHHQTALRKTDQENSENFNLAWKYLEVLTSLYNFLCLYYTGTAGALLVLTV